MAVPCPPSPDAGVGQGYVARVKPPPVLVAALGGVALLVAGIAIGAPKSKVPPPAPVATVPELPEPAEDGFVHLDKHVWSADRLRWCSFVELAGAPERQGLEITAQYDYAVGEGAVAKTWRFFDGKMSLTLTSAAATCFANAKANLPEGRYRMVLKLETAAVAVDTKVDAALAADPTWQSCSVNFPERVSSAFTVPVVVDTDGRVWASDGTRESDNLRDCLGVAATQWAKNQVDAKTFPLVTPAVVFGRVPANVAPSTGPGKSIQPRANP